MGTVDERGDVEAVVLISADAEWRAAKACLGAAIYQESPFGGWLLTCLDVAGSARRVVLLHGGWGKIAAAASAQWAIDRWRPSLLANLGTCGGFAGAVEQGAVILAERTVVYDIAEQMSDPAEAIAHYTSALDLSWLPADHPGGVLRTVLVSADRDLVPIDIPMLSARYGAVAGDWESGAIAWVAKRNRVRCLILRAVSDLVGTVGSEAYGHPDRFEQATGTIMARLLLELPRWIAAAIVNAPRPQGGTSMPGVAAG
jgi:adenosylhomocysteine nucleosidase